MTRGLHAWLLPGLVVFSVASVAKAHITLVEPVPRHGPKELKYGPCGVGPSDARTTDPALVTTYQAGETITVRWVEGINHPSHFRIALAPSDTAPADPTGFEDTSGGQYVLVDGIADTGGPNGTEYELQVILPNEPCPTCTLQLIQVMKDKPPWGGGDDIYYQCADLVIADGTVSPTGGASGTGGTLVGSGGLTSAGGSTGGSSTGGAPPTHAPSAGAAEDDAAHGSCALSGGGLRSTGPAGALWLALGVAGLLRARRRAGR